MRASIALWTLIWIVMLSSETSSAQQPRSGFSYLALGDSYTIGEGVPAEQRWPVQLAQRLSDSDLLTASPRIIARTGWTTSELIDAIERENLEPEYDFVSLLIGVNNQYRGQPIETYKKEFEDLVGQAIRFARGRPDRVVVVSIPDYGVTPFVKAAKRSPSVIARELDQYNEVAELITERLGSHWVDITPVSRARGTEQEMLADDGLHPSGPMYGLWTDAVFPVAKKALSK